MKMRDIIDLVESAGSPGETFDQFLNQLQSKGIAPIQELQTIKPHLAVSFETKEQFVEYMEKLGFKLIGAGAMGIVFAHPKLQYVLKVYENDPGYQSFVELAQKYQQNPHFPKIFGSIIVVSKPLRIRMIRTERLQPMSVPEFYKNPMKILELARKNELGDLAGDDLQLANAFRIIINQAKTTGYMLDISASNVMRRGNTVVVVDPYAEASWADQDRTNRGSLDYGYLDDEPKHKPQPLPAANVKPAKEYELRTDRKGVRTKR